MPSSLMYGRDSDTNKNVPIEFIQGTGMLIKDADIISAVDGVNSTLQGTLQVDDPTGNSYLSNIENSLVSGITVSDSIAQGYLFNIETYLSGTLAVSDTTSQATLYNIENQLLTRYNDLFNNATHVYTLDWLLRYD